MLTIPLAPDGLPIGWPDDYGIPTLAYDNEEGPGILAWAEFYLAQPDGMSAGEQWAWRETQARIVAWWYAVDAEGKFIFRRGQIVLPKGSGKSPFAAALSCCELGAPVVFHHWDADGRPVGIPHPSPYVQLAAVSADQTDNTMALVISMLQDGNAAEVIPGLNPLLTRVRTANGKLVPVTASATSREGQRITAAILDEPHLWTPQNGGTRLAAVLRRNLGKMNGRSIETTNAWEPGGESVAESTSEDADLIAERGKLGGLLRYHPKAVVPKLKDVAALRAGLRELYRDSPWIDIERIIEEIQDRSTHPADARRFYLNEVSTADDALVAAADWDACPEAEPLTEGDRISLGFDGSIREDSTALVACRLYDHAFFLLGVWEKDDKNKDWEVPRTEVDAAVHNAFEHYGVVAFYADVEHWESYIDSWSLEFGSQLVVKAAPATPIGWDMRGRIKQSTLANMALVALIENHKIAHREQKTGTLRRHALAARRRPNRDGISFGKDRRGGSRKIDAYAAMLLSEMARWDAEMSGKIKDEPDRTVLVL